MPTKSELIEAVDKLTASKEMQARVAFTEGYLDGLRVQAVSVAPFLENSELPNLMRYQREVLTRIINDSDKTTAAEKEELHAIVEEGFRAIHHRLNVNPNAEPLDEAYLSFQQKLFDSEA